MLPAVENPWVFHVEEEEEEGLHKHFEWLVLKRVQRVLATYLHGNLVGACSSK